MRIGALGRTKFLYDSIVRLYDRGHDIVFIITTKEEDSYDTKSEDFRKLAADLGIPFLMTKPSDMKQLPEWIEGHMPDIGISVNWKTIIEKHILDCFPGGIINAHAGDLPRFRGNATPNWAIIAGEDKVVLTLHFMSESLDAGAILLKREFPIDASTYIGDIYGFLSENIPDMFVDVIEGLESNTIVPQIQPDETHLSSRCYPRMPRDCEIDWREDAVRIVRLIHASSEPFAGAYSFIGTKKLIVWKAHAVFPEMSYFGTPGQVAEINSENGEVCVVSGNGMVVLEEVEIDGMGKKKASQVINGIRLRLGIDISGEILLLSKRIERLENLLKNRCDEK